MVLSVLGSCCPSCDLVFLVNFLRQPSFPQWEFMLLYYPSLNTQNILAFWKLFYWSECILNPITLRVIRVHLLLSAASLYRVCKCFSKRSVCVCRITVVSKRVRAVLLHQWLVFQAYICGEINAECWERWDRYVASDSSPSYTQIDAHINTLSRACTHSGWTQHWFEEVTLAVITECLTCYFKLICSCAHIFTNTLTHAKQKKITASFTFSFSHVYQTHDACVEWGQRLILYSRWLPGQPQIGCHRPE